MPTEAKDACQDLGNGCWGVDFRVVVSSFGVCLGTDAKGSNWKKNNFKKTHFSMVNR